MQFQHVQSMDKGEGLQQCKLQTAQMSVVKQQNVAC